jgi:basic membrane protein A and related proteins
MRLTRRSVLGTVAILAGVLAFPPLASAADPMRVAIVMPGNITDKSWNQAGYEGLMRAKDELGIEVAFSEKVAQPDQAEAMADYARRGYSIVIGHGGEFQEAANRVASRHPETMFVVNNGTEPAENLATADFYYRQFGYLLGYLGGKMSETGKGGFIGAQKIKFSTDLQESFVEGFKAARSDGEVFVAWTNDWDDIAKGKEAALNQINQGADVIFPTMDNAAIGSLQAAKDNGAWAFGLYYDAIEDWPDTVLQSAIFDIRSAMVSYLDQAKGEGLKGQNYKYSLSTPEAARLGSYHSGIPDELEKEIEDLAGKMKQGELEP